MDDSPKDPKIAGLPLQFGKGKIMKIISALFSTGALVFLLHSQALATPPEISFFEDHFEFPIAVCDEVEIIRVLDLKVTVKVFFDNNGIENRIQITERQKNIVFNSITGEYISSPGNVNIQVDLTDGTEAHTGAPIIVTLPGIGPFIRDSGRLVLDADFNVIFEAGNFDFGPMGDASLFCEALG